MGGPEKTETGKARMGDWGADEAMGVAMDGTFQSTPLGETVWANSPVRSRTCAADGASSPASRLDARLLQEEERAVLRE